MASTYTGVSVKVENLRPTIAALEKAGVDIADLKEAFKEIGIRVERRAKAITHDRSGNLDRGIRASNRKNAAIITSRATVSINSQGKSQGRRGYHRNVYYGSKHNPNPLPYLVMAVQDNHFQIRDLLVFGVNKAIRDAGF